MVRYRSFRLGSDQLSDYNIAIGQAYHPQRAISSHSYFYSHLRATLVWRVCVYFYVHKTTTIGTHHPQPSIKTHRAREHRRGIYHPSQAFVAVEILPEKGASTHTILSLEHTTFVLHGCNNNNARGNNTYSLELEVAGQQHSHELLQRWREYNGHSRAGATKMI